MAALIHPLDWNNCPRDAGMIADVCETALRLPQLHDALTAGLRCPRRAVDELVQVVAKPVHEGVLPDSDEHAHFFWIATCFVMAAAERWGRTAGLSSGAAYAMLGPNSGTWIDGMMHRTDAIAPRMGVSEYWLNNKASTSSPTFTGSNGEHSFRAQVQLVDRATRTVASALHSIVAGEVNLVDAHELLKECSDAAAAMNRGVIDLHKSFAPAEFHRGMRQPLLSIVCPVAGGGAVPTDAHQYVCAQEINGKVYEGPNAANILGVPMVDLLLGLADEPYRRMIRDRFQWFDTRDQAQIERAMDTATSMTDVLARALELPTTALVHMDAPTLAAILNDANPAVMRSVSQFAMFTEHYRKWSGAHLSAIERHVINVGVHITPAELASLPVSYTAGISGNSTRHAQHIAALRKGGFNTSQLPAAVRMAMQPANDPVFAAGR